jgi:hypothetical protein
MIQIILVRTACLRGYRPPISTLYVIWISGGGYGPRYVGCFSLSKKSVISLKIFASLMVKPLGV